MIGSVWIMIFAYLAGCSGVTDNKPVAGEQVTGKQVTVDTFARKPFVYDSTKKYIYLTFDDGPQHGTTTCYEICKADSIKATFFMVGLHTAKKTDGKKIVAMIRAGYPEILLANHSYTHANDKYVFFYHHPEMAAQDFFEAQDFLHVPYKIVRLPGNSAWMGDTVIKASNLVRPVVRILDSAGYNAIGWDVEWHFQKKTARPVQSPQKLAEQVDTSFARNHTHTPNHLVILTHDRMFQRPEDAAALDSFIHILKQNPDYILETVDHYPGLKKLK